MVESGQVDLKPLVAARIPLSRAQEAFDALKSGLTTGFKIIVDCTGKE